MFPDLGLIKQTKRKVLLSWRNLFTGKNTEALQWHLTKLQMLEQNRPILEKRSSNDAQMTATSMENELA